MKLLFHACCAPCILYPQSVIEDINTTYYFYNPNIHPEAEYMRRKGAIIDYCGKFNIPLIIGDPNGENFSTYSQREKIWTDFNKAERCKMCYSTRIKRTAKYAFQNGFDSFSTTLLGSIYQDHDLIIKLGNKYAEEYSVDFFYQDFRVGFREGQKMAREDGMYRQKYCGCICSLEESSYKEKILASLKSDQS